MSSPPQSQHADAIGAYDDAVRRIIVSLRPELGNTIAVTAGSTAAGVPVASQLEVRSCIEEMLRAHEKELQDRYSKELTAQREHQQRLEQLWKHRAALVVREVGKENQQNQQQCHDKDRRQLAEWEARLADHQQRLTAQEAQAAEASRVHEEKALDLEVMYRRFGEKEKAQEAAGRELSVQCAKLEARQSTIVDQEKDIAEKRKALEASLREQERGARDSGRELEARRTELSVQQSEVAKQKKANEDRAQEIERDRQEVLRSQVSMQQDRDQQKREHEATVAREKEEIQGRQARLAEREACLSEREESVAGLERGATASRQQLSEQIKEHSRRQTALDESEAALSRREAEVKRAEVQLAEARRMDAQRAEDQRQEARRAEVQRGREGEAEARLCEREQALLVRERSVLEREQAVASREEDIASKERTYAENLLRLRQRQTELEREQVQALKAAEDRQAQQAAMVGQERIAADRSARAQEDANRRVAEAEKQISKRLADVSAREEQLTAKEARLAAMERTLADRGREQDEQRRVQQAQRERRHEQEKQKQRANNLERLLEDAEADAAADPAYQAAAAATVNPTRKSAPAGTRKHLTARKHVQGVGAPSVGAPSLAVSVAPSTAVSVAVSVAPSTAGSPRGGPDRAAGVPARAHKVEAAAGSTGVKRGWDAGNTGSADASMPPEQAPSPKSRALEASASDEEAATASTTRKEIASAISRFAAHAWRLPFGGAGGGGRE